MNAAKSRVCVVAVGLGVWALLVAPGACVLNETVDDETDGGLAGASSGGGGLRFDGGRAADGGAGASSSGATGSSSHAGGTSSSSGGGTSSSSSGGVHPDGGTPVHPDAGGWTPGGTASCVVWQDCPPHFGDLNSGFECTAGQCICDPSGQFAATCASWNRTWVAEECQCPLDTSGPPQSNPDDNPNDDVQCWWSWHSDGCDPDRWVDTSYYDHRCETVNGQTECRDVWVDSGYWEDGDCTGGNWIKRCSDGTEIWY